MALSMDEQRVLAEIEKRLAAEEPALAACMTAFRRPGPGLRLKSPRARILGSLFTVALVAVISLMVYAMLPFRMHPAKAPGTGSVPGQTTLTSSSRPSSGTAVSVSAPVSAPAGHAATHTTAVGAKAATGTSAAGPKNTGALSTAKPAMGPAQRSGTHP